MVEKEAKKQVKRELKIENRGNVDKLLMDNFVGLQKALTNLAVRLEGLSDQIAKLLNLFEISAKSFVQKADKYGQTGIDKEFIEKINTLLEQNKIIARGLLLIEDKMGREEPIRRSDITARPLPRI